MNKFLIIGTLLFLFPAVPAAAEAKWKCGDWKKDAKGKCEEVRVCTRTVCDATGKIENCRNETRTECANPIPPKTGKTPSSLMLEGLSPSGGRVQAIEGQSVPAPRRDGASSQGSDAKLSEDVPTKPGYVWVNDHWERERAKKK